MLIMYGKGGYVDEYDVAVGSLWYTDDTYDFDNEIFKLIPGSTDAFLALGISKQIKADIIYNDSGLYTCEEAINGGFTRARVELKVSREGTFNVALHYQLLLELLYKYLVEN